MLHTLPLLFMLILYHVYIGKYHFIRSESNPINDCECIVKLASYVLHIFPLYLETHEATVGKHTFTYTSMLKHTSKSKLLGHQYYIKYQQFILAHTVCICRTLLDCVLISEPSLSVHSLPSQNMGVHVCSKGDSNRHQHESERLFLFNYFPPCSRRSHLKLNYQW